MKKRLFATVLSMIMVMSVNAGVLAEEGKGETGNTAQVIVEETDAEANPPEETEKEAIPPEEQVEEEKLAGNRLLLDIYIDDSDNFLPGRIVFGIYGPNKQFWGAKDVWAPGVGRHHTMNFRVPEYEWGDTLYLKLYSGAEKIQYGFDFYKADEFIPVKTFKYVSEETGKTIYGDEAAVTAKPLSSEFLKAYANGWELYFKSPAKLINGVTMIPLFEYLEALSMKRCALVGKDGRIEIKANGRSVVFYLDGHDMYADGQVSYGEVTPQKINEVIYVPFRFLVEGLGGAMTAENIEGVLNVKAELEYMDAKSSERFVKDITSRTDYLVWISKKDYRVTVFKNINGEWSQEAQFLCSIGAPATPTITGQYEYFSREYRWNYPTYYVGPIMRFYNGYALHSTLIGYDGSPADARLEKMISHGCIRMAPADINWMVENVPLYTKIYITE